MPKNYYNATIVIKCIVVIFVFPIIFFYYSFCWPLAYLYLRYHTFNNMKKSIQKEKKEWIIYLILYILFLPIDLPIGLAFSIYSFIFFFKAPSFHTIEDDFKAILGMAWIMYFIEKIIIFGDENNG